MGTELTVEEKAYFDKRGDAPEPAEAPEVVVTPFAEEPETPEAPEQDNKGQFVRLAALKEERGKRQDLERRLREREEHQSRLEQRLNEIAETVRRDEPAAEIPAWDKDPLGHTKTRLDTQEERLARFEDWERKQEEGRTQEAQYRQFAAAAQGHVAAFVKEQPDYFDAFRFAMESIDKQLEHAGYPPAQRQNILIQQERAITANALEAGENPAAKMYGLARHLGWKAQAQPNPNEKLRNIAEGQKGAKSLSSAPGAAKQALTAEVVANMDNDDFKALIADKKKFRELFR